MNTRKYRYILAASMILMGGAAMAQNLNSAYFTDQFAFRHTMNPAYGNDQNFVSIPALGNVNVSMQGNFGYEDVVMKNPRYGIDSQKKMTTFMNPYISDSKALGGFSTGNNRMVADVNVALLAAGFKAFGGYNTIELNSKSAAGMSLPYELFRFARNTGNETYDIGDINVHAQSYLELAFGHSRNVSDKLRLGAKLKLLFGVARGDFQFKDVKADLSAPDRWTVSGDAKAEVSMKGFRYEMKQKEYDAGSGTYEKIDDVDIDGGGLGGFGMAVDLGAVYKVNDDWTLSASVLDLGFISWSNDVTASNSSKSFEFGGFHDTAVKKDRPGAIDEQKDKYSDQLTDFINLQEIGGKTGGRTTGIGATVNVGCEYELPAYRKMSFGLLSSTRIKGEYSWTEGRLSANWKPLKWLDGGLSFAVSSFSTSMGYVVNIHPKGYNFFIGMDHILGKMSKEAIPLSSNASVSLGMSVTW